MLETSPTLRWTGKVGDASVFRVWDSRAFVRDTSADKLSARAIPCVFLGFPPDAPGWQFYHPTSRRVFPSQDITSDESVPFYHPLPGTVPVEVAVASGAARGSVSRGAASGDVEPGGAESEGARSGRAEPGGAKPGGADSGGAELRGAYSAGVEFGGAKPEGVEPGGAESEGAESGGAEPQGTATSGGPAGASPRLSPRPEPLSLQQLHEWFAQRTRLRSGAARAGDSAAGDPGAGGAGVTARASSTGGLAAADPGGARTKGTGAAGTSGVGGAGAGGARARDTAEPGGAGAGGTGAGGAGAGGAGAVGAGAGGTGAGGARAGDTGAGGAGARDVVSGDTERREPESRPASPVRAVRRVPCPRPPPVPGTYAMALRPSSVPLRVPLPAPPESSLLAIPDPDSDLARAASPTVSRLLATVVNDPVLESTAASALVAELLDFATACHLDCTTAHVAES
ncbi:unnamed protein product [Closterium sp. NIES-53]